MASGAQFRTVAQMMRLIGHGLGRVPRDARFIVAASEGGLVPAAILGLQTGRSVVDLDRALMEGVGRHGRSLVVDDVGRGGGAMASARQRLKEAFPGCAVTTLAVYAEDGAAGAADLVFETVPGPLLCEWSLFRSPGAERTCFDMDGILCADCLADDDDDGPRYRRFLGSATPFMTPRGRLRRIVTSRLEKYRAETEDWLARHGIAYEALDMLDLPSEAERRRLRPQARFKAEVFAADDRALLFVESESWQARQIAIHAGGKLVFDYESRTLLDAALLAETAGRAGAETRLLRRLRRAADLGRRTLGLPWGRRA